MIIGLTGNIGSGKSTAAHMLAALGAGVIDADKAGHAVLMPGGEAYQPVIDAFGRDFVAEDGTILRKKLGAYVFADAGGSRLKTLNAITHPAIHHEVCRRIAALQKDGKAVIVVEAALLFDSTLQELTDENWLVTAPQKELLARVARRDNCDEETAMHRLRSQRPAEELAKLADRVFVNDSSLAALREKLETAYRNIPER